MTLGLYRVTLTPQSTIGKLFVDGQFFCYSLELPVKDGLPGSAIPAGVYPIELAPSPKFQARAQNDPFWANYADKMPHIINIPARSLIMLHVGNLPSETDGCVLVGETQGINCIGTSRPAFQKLYNLITSALQTPDGCSIAIHDAPLQPALGVDLATQV